MTDWFDPIVLVGVAQAGIAFALVYFTISLAKSTEAYSRQVERQTSILEKNNKFTEDAIKNAEKSAERERLLKKYERLTNEMVNFIAPLYSRVGDMQVFRLDIPAQKIIEKRQQQIDDINRETYSFWENCRRNKYLNQSDEVRRMFHNYFAVIENARLIRAREPQTENERKELEREGEFFERYRASLFESM